MSQINRPPQGLQSLLGSQNFGDNPKQLGGVVAPTLDMLPFYGAGILRLRRISSSLAAEGEITSLTFDDQVAVLSVTAWNAAGSAVAGVNILGVAISGPPSDNLPVNQQHMLAIGPYAATGAVTTQPAVCHSFPFPLVVEPGTSFHAHWLFNSGGNNSTVQLTVLFYDLSQT